MKRLALLTISLLLAACGESHTSGDDDAGTDSGIMIDFDAASLPDAPGAVCGNGRLEVGEMCDDGNTAPGDGCDGSCVREAFCGDEIVNGTEVCDDGNNRSGDGCRSDCMSDESCGNGIVDYAAGEVCDGSPMCDATCTSVTGCGEGPEVAPSTPGAACDDLNTLPFDGCDAACQTELTLVLDSLGLGSSSEGCDLNGDGTPDNAFARALGALGSALGPLIQMAIRNGNLTLLMGFLGLDDAENDPDFRIAWLQGEDADGDASNNFGGMGQFSVNPASINPDGSPTTSIQSRVMSGMISGGPEDIPLPLPIPIELQQGQVRGDVTVGTDGFPDGIDEGLLCGGVPVNLLSLLGGFLGGAGGMLETDPPCDGGAEASLLDLIIAGGTANANFMGTTFPLVFRATPPDLDLDGDGLEGFEVQNSGPSGCQGVVVACIDGDGTRIPGRDCYSSPQIGDGYSAAFTYSAVRAQLVPMP